MLQERGYSARSAVVSTGTTPALVLAAFTAPTNMHMFAQVLSFFSGEVASDDSLSIALYRTTGTKAGGTALVVAPANDDDPVFTTGLGGSALDASGAAITGLTLTGEPLLVAKANKMTEGIGEKATEAGFPKFGAGTTFAVALLRAPSTSVDINIDLDFGLI